MITSDSFCVTNHEMKENAFFMNFEKINKTFWEKYFINILSALMKNAIHIVSRSLKDSKRQKKGKKKILSGAVIKLCLAIFL